MSYPPPPQDPNQPDPYGQQNPYGQPQHPYGQPVGGTDHPRGTLILVLGILSIVCCGLFTGIKVPRGWSVPPTGWP